MLLSMFQFNYREKWLFTPTVLRGDDIYRIDLDNHNDILVQCRYDTSNLRTEFPQLLTTFKLTFRY